jgi:hypothetical protein
LAPSGDPLAIIAARVIAVGKQTFLRTVDPVAVTNGIREFWQACRKPLTGKLAHIGARSGVVHAYYGNSHGSMKALYGALSKNLAL